MSVKMNQLAQVVKAARLVAEEMRNKARVESSDVRVGRLEGEVAFEKRIISVDLMKKGCKRLKRRIVAETND